MSAFQEREAMDIANTSSSNERNNVDFSKNIVIKFVDYRKRRISDVEKEVPDAATLSQDYRMLQFNKVVDHFNALKNQNGPNCQYYDQDILLEVDLSCFESTEAMKRVQPQLFSRDHPTSIALHEYLMSTVMSSLKTSNSPSHSCKVNILIAAFSFDLRLLYHSIDVVIDQIADTIKESLLTLLGKYSNPTISSWVDLQVTLLEDLVYVDRPYIWESKYKNFFKNLSTKYCDKNMVHIPHFNVNGEEYELSVTCSLELKSSNQIINLWGQGDCRIVSISEFQNPREMAESYWHRILTEISFSEMFNQGNKVPRLISIQSIADNELGNPLYRHPNDEEPPNIPMIPLVREIMALVEQYTGVRGLNHVLIQHYRDGRDNIAQHSDKTLDIDLNTPILNLSFGCPRDMYIQNKDNRNRLEKIPLHHGECVVFGLQTNQFWFHEVPKDVTMRSHSVFETSRVSFKFRSIVTFVHPMSGVLIGQGSPFKTMEQFVSSHQRNNVETETGNAKQTRSKLITAFGKENRQSSEFDWNEVYGQGFLAK